MQYLACMVGFPGSPSFPRPSGKEVREELGRRIRRIRKRKGWSRRTLAERALSSERSLADLEAGRGNPSLSRLLDLAAALGLSLGALLGGLGEGGRRSRVALLGLRGAGKSTVGARLAARLGWSFLELDACIEERAGLALSELFEMHGERRFRVLEREALEACLDRQEPFVIATGGGLVGEEETYARLRASCFCVWLRARPEDHWERVLSQGDTRPMRDRERAFADLRAILAEREPLYRRADLVLDTSGRDPGSLAAEIAARL